MHLGSLLGIPVLVDPLFLVMLFGLSLFGFFPQTLVLFWVVLLHELAHVLVAKYNDLFIEEIELLPFGGVARIDGMLQLNPPIEIRVAIAGPLVNLILAGVTTFFFDDIPVSEQWLLFFIQANFGMAIFNLLPTLPLDGGRVLRSILTSKMGFKQATERVVFFSKFLAIIIALLGVAITYIYGNFNSLIFLVMGFFIFTASHKEKREATYLFMRYLTRKKQQLRLARVMDVRQLVATDESSLGEILRKFVPPNYHIVWIVDLEGTIIGKIGEIDLINALFDKGLTTKIGDLI